MKKLMIFTLLFIQFPAFGEPIYSNSPKPGLWGSCRLSVSRQLNSSTPKFKMMSFFEENASDSLLKLLHYDLKSTLKATRSSSVNDLSRVLNIAHSSENVLELSLSDKHDVSLSFFYFAKLINYLTFEFAYQTSDKSDTYLSRFYETVQAVSTRRDPQNYYRAISQFAPLTYELVHKSQIPRDIQEALNKNNNPSKGDYKGTILAGKMDSFYSADVWGASLMDMNNQVERISLLERDYTFMQLRIKSDNPKFISFLIKKLKSQLALVRTN